MKIFLAGGTGFIGGHLLEGLLAQGHEVTALVRPSTVSRPARSGVTWLQGEWLTPQQWLPVIAGHQAVVHSVGLIRERGNATFDAVQTEVPIRLHAAALDLGVRTFVQISALGAQEGATTRFLRTKLAADQHLAQSGLRHLILRPSFVYGPGDHSMAFFERLAHLPVVPLPEGGWMRIQPLHVQDLVRATLAWTEGGQPSAAFDLGGAEALSFREVLERLRGKSLRSLAVPAWGMDLAAKSTDLLGGGPITRDELRMLRSGSTCDNGPFIQAFGFEPLPFSRGLALRNTSTGARHGHF
ncbi:MAG: NAD(P)H-binding protein [Acidobacteria bacterium]|nr:NAD(P)H-binding protein [Acidobacteriota bacterium]